MLENPICLLVEQRNREKKPVGRTELSKMMQEKDFAVFLKDGDYENWESLETNKDRVAALKEELGVAEGRNQVQANALNEANLKNV